MVVSRFTRLMRLRKNVDFRKVFNTRSSVADQLLVVYAMPNGLPQARLGVSVSKKHGNAVKRNRWKRAIREAFRLNQAQIPQGFDYVVLPKYVKGVDRPLPTSRDVAASVTALAAEAARRAERKVLQQKLQ